MSTTNQIDEDFKLVNPNLGHPKILSIDKDLKIKDVMFQMDLLFTSNVKNPDEFVNVIKDKIEIIPLLEYKPKLRLNLEKKINKLKKKLKKEGVWSRFRRKKVLKKDHHLKLREIKLRKLKPHAYRGSPIIPGILNVKKIPLKTISDLNYEEFGTPLSYLVQNNVYRNLYIYYKVSIEFNLTDEILDFLKRRNFVMFDINQKIDQETIHINYHSVVVSKQEWNNFTFVHATDLHLAERNDKIYEIIKKWTKLFGLKEQEKFLEDQKKDFEKMLKLEDNPIYVREIKKPLKKRLINPNNQMRKFIKLMNRKVLHNDLDFIALTGDLVDYTILSKLPKEKRVFDYDHTNWRVFKEIVLNLPQKKRRGMVSGEELLCPIFTITGNHDYRPFHYDLRWAGLYRKIGLKAIEALALNDKFISFPITSIIKSTRALKGYFSEINPSLDYSFRLGKNNFIFLNSGSDSFRNIGDLLTGHPSLTGLTNMQIKYLENLINYKFQEDDNNFLFLHGPVINPKKKVGIIKRIKHRFGKKILTRIESMKESVLKKFEKKPSKTRIDDKVNVKFGTIASNWEKLVEFCNRYCVLTLTGHTHALKEFRLADTDKVKSTVYDAPPFNLRKIENPAAIYYDNYSDIYTNTKDIAEFCPFVVQTPALGLGGFKNPKLTGGYREIKIEDEKLASFKVKYIHRLLREML